MMPFNFKKRCCDPFGLKKCSRKLISIRPSIRLKLEKLKVGGNAICSSCNIKVSNLKVIESTLTLPSSSAVAKSLGSDISNFSSASVNSSESESDLDQESEDELAEYEKTELIDSLNRNILPALRVSPINLRKMSSKKYTVEKFQMVASGMKRIFGSVQDLTTMNEFKVEKSKAQQFDGVIQKLKTKFHEANTKNEKYQILTMLPVEWSARKIEVEFGCSFHMANSAKKLQKEKGVHSIPNPKLPSNILERGIKKLVEEFYLEDDISRIMPGKNDCVSMIVNGKVFYDSFVRKLSISLT